MMQIYIHRNGQRYGPYSEADIKAHIASGALSRQDNAWWAGQAGWVPLGQSPFAATFPPALPGTAAYYADYAPAETSQSAIWSLVCGCLSLLCGLFTSIPAVILGHMALSEIKKNPRLQGRGMAIAGLIIGYIVLAIGVLYLGVVALSIIIAISGQSGR